jgi:ubiquinol-cytochrome c reductase cytochrome c subunit
MSTVNGADHADQAEREGTLVTDEIDVEGEYGFEPAVSVTGAAETDSDVVAPARSRARRRPAGSKRRSAVRRRVGALAILFGALASMGGAYAAFAASSTATDTGSSPTDVAAGRQLYQVSCITCHGANLQGVKSQGPSLVGVGSAAVYFQVSTGRMPAAGQGAYEIRKEAKFNEAQTNQLAAYIQSVGGGPQVPLGNLQASAKDIANGGALFRLNCASCHGATGKGAPLSAGKQAPSLNASNSKQLYAAMLSGPENMPVFSDNELTPFQKRSIIAYVQTLKNSDDPGGSGIDRVGPVSEAIVIWVGGVGALMITILWIGARSR